MFRPLRSLAVVAALLAASVAAEAGPCTSRDAWTGPDKTKHLAAGAAIASATTLATKNPDIGFWTGTAVALGKEVLYDRSSPIHTCSFQDFAVTVAGAAAGAYGTALIVLPLLDREGKPKGAQLVFSKRL